jgi:diacylglycerol kinase family enzyme
MALCPLIVVINPVCGSSEGKQFVDEHVLPALEAGLSPPTAVYTTERIGHAGDIVLEHLKKKNITSLTVVVASGDGTVHEIINTVQDVAGKPYEIEFVLVPVRGAFDIHHPSSNL